MSVKMLLTLLLLSSVSAYRGFPGENPSWPALTCMHVPAEFRPGVFWLEPHAQQPQHAFQTRCDGSGRTLLALANGKVSGAFWSSATTDLRFDNAIAGGSIDDSMADFDLMVSLSRWSALINATRHEIGAANTSVTWTLDGGKNSGIADGLTYHLRYDEFDLETPDYYRYRHQAGACLVDGNSAWTCGGVGLPKLQHNDLGLNAWTGNWAQSSQHPNWGSTNGCHTLPTGWYGACGFTQFGLTRTSCDADLISHPITAKGDYSNPSVCVEQKQVWLEPLGVGAGVTWQQSRIVPSTSLTSLESICDDASFGSWCAQRM